MAPTRIVFETHATTDDNEAGIATGWGAGRLSEVGRRQAAELGVRRSDDHIDAIFCSDLARAVQTASIAFTNTQIPLLLDWRLRECDYGHLNGGSVDEVHGDRTRFLDEPYPGGESWSDAAARMHSFVRDLLRAWSGQRVLVIGHAATRWGLEHALGYADLAVLIGRPPTWQPGWQYTIDDPRTARSADDTDPVRWGGTFDDDELNHLHADAFGHQVFHDEWNAQLAQFSIGWVTARQNGDLVGFLNVVGDGGIHAWLQDVIVSTGARRTGLGVRMVKTATENARALGCEWLHVDFDDEHRDFYFGACGFEPTNAGLIKL